MEHGQLSAQEQPRRRQQATSTTLAAADKRAERETLEAYNSVGATQGGLVAP